MKDEKQEDLAELKIHRLNLLETLKKCKGLYSASPELRTVRDAIKIIEYAISELQK